MERTLNMTINRPRNEKNDEYYTQLSDIEDEVRHYRSQSATNGTMQIEKYDMEVHRTIDDHIYLNGVQKK